MDKNVVWHHGGVNRRDREKLLEQKGIVLWFTGLSGSGKSTVAVELEKALLDSGKLVCRLDGDNIRHGLNKELGFSNDDRFENIRRIAEVAKLFKDSGIITLASFISPLTSMRKMARDIVGADDFVEIFVKCSIEKCRNRDPKELYKKADAGLIKNFTGITSKYEEPEAPELTLDTESLSVFDSVKKILGFLNIKC